MTRLVAVVAAALALAPAASTRAADAPWGLVTHSGSQLMLDGKPFRFSGANIEWLGLIGYGPLNFQPGQTERFPSHYEVDDALATAKEMGATVVRAQTLGDTVGCTNCLEPKLGQWNPAAFRVMDYAIMRARYYGIRLILEFQGDSRAVPGESSTDKVFSDWRGGASFYSDPTVISDFENHIAHVIDHVNSITGIPYKDDPTILGWMDCNACSTGTGATDAWVSTIAAFVKSRDHRHLFLDNNTIAPDSTLLADPNIDVFAAEIYPHWFQLASGDRATGQAPVPHQIAAMTTGAGKAWLMSEFGWDRTNWLTTNALETFLTGIKADPNISGDLFWALQGHANGRGWEPMVADERCQAGSLDDSPPGGDASPGGAGCFANEDGNWWALYYPGIDTLSNTATDMAARAQLLRAHAYAMSGFDKPPSHETVPAPVITSTDAGKVAFEGAAGSPNYSVQKRTGATWPTLCDRCTTDADSGWTDPGAPGCYRVVGYNLDGVAGPPSAPAGSGCPKTAAAAPSTCASKRSVRYTVPAGARSVRVTVDGKPHPVRRRGRTLLLSLNGLARRTVTVRITWRQHGHRHARTSLLHPCTTSPACDDPQWAGAWSTAQAAASTAPGFGDHPQLFDDQSLRMILTPHYGGSQLRIRMTNRFGAQALTFDGVYVGWRSKGAALVPGTNRPVTFQGQKAVSIPPGAVAWSDPVRLPVRPFEDLAVSFHIPGGPTPLDVHPEAWQTSYLGALGGGSHGGEAAGDAFTTSTPSRYAVDEVDVLSSHAAASLVALGDSITDGTGSTTDGNTRWPDALQRRLEAASGAPPISVLNAGIGANQVATDSPLFGPSAASRSEFDVFSRTAVTDMVLFEGINDIDLFGNPVESADSMASRIIAAQRDIIGRAHARGIRVIGATITPAAQSGSKEQARELVNKWIRTSGTADAVADFDAAVRDPADRTRVAAAYDHGDGLHLNDAGYRVLAQRIDLASLRGRRCEVGS